MSFNNYANRVIKQDVAEEAKLNFMSDVIPDKILPTIQPVITVEKKYCDVTASVTATVSGTSATIYTTPTDKDFYITSAFVAIAKDAACDATTNTLRISITKNGATGVVILGFPYLVSTAMNQVVSMSFPKPLKVDRNTTVALVYTSHTAGLFSKMGGISGFTSDTNSAV